MKLPSYAKRSRRGGGRAPTPLRALVAALVTALCLTGLAAAPASAQSPPTDIALGWGWNEVGALGDGTTTDRLTPTPVDLPAGVQLTALSAGHGFSLGLTADGGVYAWGINNYGQLGDGTTTSSLTPVEVDLPAGVHVTALASGSNHTLALTADGRVYAWGWNAYGQLGDGTTTDRATPVPVDLPAGTTITAVAAGDNGEFSLAATSDGHVLGWGLNRYGQLGNGTTLDSITPTEASLPAGTQVTDLAAGAGHSLALTSTGSVYAWGLNGSGQLGDGTTTDRHTPVQILPAGSGIAALTAGAIHSLLMTTDGRVYAWGDNTFGGLGDGTTTQRNEPVRTQLPAGADAVAIAAGNFHSLALTSDGRIFAWGLNSRGEVGDGTTTDRLTPVAVHLPAGLHATAIAAGTLHSLALAVRAQSMTTLTASPGVIQPGQDVTLTADVICSAGTPTGEVVFYDGTDPIGTGTLDASGSATLTAMLFAPGNHTITAHYEGDGTCPASVSEPVTVTVLAPEPGASLGLTKEPVSTGPFEVGDTVQYTYTVTNTGEAPLSSVAVTDDRVADVDCEATSLAPGEHTTCRGTYVVTEADAVCGPRDSGSNGRGNGGYGGGHGGTCPVTNTAEAAATDTRGDTITSNTATATIQVTSGGGGGYGHGSDYGNGNGNGNGNGRKKEAKTA
ncbi:Ig-like domain repeat protein [Streptomyces sp. NPDC046203]|uniref:RCC1 domain-containing protein n=1 Tax=Streptomyces sp. NPDC046203 TaxID=3154602 RepID=UPI0033E7FE4E